MSNTNNNESIEDIYDKMETIWLKMTNIEKSPYNMYKKIKNQEIISKCYLLQYDCFSFFSFLKVGFIKFISLFKKKQKEEKKN